MKRQAMRGIERTHRARRRAAERRTHRSAPRFASRQGYWDTDVLSTRPFDPVAGIETSTYFATGLRERYATAGASGRNRLIYDCVNVVLKKLPTGTIAVYTQNPQEPGGLLAAKAGADHRFPVPDMQGHVRQITDANGDVAPEAAAYVTFVRWLYVTVYGWSEEQIHGSRDVDH